MIVNKQKDALPSTFSLRQFAEEMKYLDLTNIPIDQRPQAVRDHFAKVVVAGLENRDLASKVASGMLLRHVIQ